MACVLGSPAKEMSNSDIRLAGPVDILLGVWACQNAQGAERGGEGNVSVE
jgi:hypothetical protein